MVERRPVVGSGTEICALDIICQRSAWERLELQKADIDHV